MKRYFFSLFLLLRLSTTAQTLPDSIVIIKNIYASNHSGGEALFSTDEQVVRAKGRFYRTKHSRIRQSKILALLNALHDPSNKDHSLAKFGVDTGWIRENPWRLLQLYTGSEQRSWNTEQLAYIYPKLTNIAYYEKEVKDFLNYGCCATMHNPYRVSIMLKLYRAGTVTEEVCSRKFLSGYLMPWTSAADDTLYNYAIETCMRDILSGPWKGKAPMSGQALLQTVVNKIFVNEMQDLFRLSGFSYPVEIVDLKKDFDVISTEEVYGRGRYLGNEGKTIKIVLKNKLMLNNVSVAFMASAIDSRLYSRDSLKRDYPVLIGRIQSIPFIHNFLLRHPQAQLDIYYFNHRGINDYNIDGVNKKPADWVKYDQYLESLKWDTKNNIKLDFDTARAKKNAEFNYCGCNYRFDKSFIEKAVFFEITEDLNTNSIWFLLPDGKALLYLTEGNSVLDFDRTEFGHDYMLFPCALFTPDGTRIQK